MTDLASLIREVNGRGFLVHNLFQLSMTRWRVNLRTEDFRFSEFAEGNTAEDALTQVLRKAPDLHTVSDPAAPAPSRRTIVIRKKAV